MQKPCNCEFLFGIMTSQVSKSQITQALNGTEETQVIILLYKSDGNLNLRKNSVKKKNFKIFFSRHKFSLQSSSCAC